MASGTKNPNLDRIHGEMTMEMPEVEDKKGTRSVPPNDSDFILREPYTGSWERDTDWKGL